MNRWAPGNVHQAMMRRIVLTLLSAALLMAACAPGRVRTDRVRTDRVEIFDIAGKPESEWGYRSKEIEVASGTTVTFVNAGIVFHTVTSDDPGRPFDKGANPGEEVTVRFERAGTFAYHCGIHPDMKGVVHVCDGQCPRSTSEPKRDR